MDKNLPANAGNRAFDPRSGKIPHYGEQLTRCASPIEPASCKDGSLELVLWSKRGHRNEEPKH